MVIVDMRVFRCGTCNSGNRSSRNFPNTFTSKREGYLPCDCTQDRDCNAAYCSGTVSPGRKNTSGSLVRASNISKGNSRQLRNVTGLSEPDARDLSVNVAP